MSLAAAPPVPVLGGGQMFQRLSFDFLKPAEFSTICAAAALASALAAARYLSG